MTKFTKGQHVYYTSGNGNHVVAIVRQVLSGGYVRVESRFFVDDNGDDIPGYLGYLFSLKASALRTDFAPKAQPLFVAQQGANGWNVVDTQKLAIVARALPKAVAEATALTFAARA